MKILLAIKPKFAYLIFSGIKKYEFRKVLFSNSAVDHVVVYASSPVQKVIGEFQIESVLQDEIENLWQTTKNQAGITKAYFDQYFINKKIGFAIKIKDAKMYPEALCLKSDYKIPNPPQSFMYLFESSIGSKEYLEAGVHRLQHFDETGI